MNYYTYDLECIIERKEKDCANEDEKIGYTDATLDLTRRKKEIDEFVRAIRRRIYTQPFLAGLWVIRPDPTG